jgi:hypothetical protein
MNTARYKKGIPYNFNRQASRQASIAKNDKEGQFC